MTIREALEKLDKLDEDNSAKRAVGSNLRVMLTHMLKCIYQPEYENKNSWKASIMNGYNGMTDEFPSLKGTLYKNFYLEELDLEHIYTRARLNASGETGKSIDVFPEDCPWTKEQLVDPRFINDFIEKYCK